ncbi:MAG TPA: DUF305 domain-containing protein [Chloroflexota bacterium]|nr:DUF305 domain-containing protein [Chloroflexota bacterium]
MSHNRRMLTRRGFAAPVSGIALWLAGSACRPGETGDAPFDRQFIDMMVPHHEGAVEMARIAQQRAERMELKQLAEAIIRTQSEEIRQLKAWRRAWYGSEQTPPMSRMPMVPGMAGMAGHGAGHGGTAVDTMDMAADVERLRRAPEPFDRAFIEAMIPHHESAIEAARAAGTRAQRQEIKDLAQTIIRDQEREIAELRQWRQSWFGSA